MFETLILGVIAALLFFKLFSVLGKRSGTERQQPKPYEILPPPVRNEEAQREGIQPLPAGRFEEEAGSMPRSVADGLASIRQADPSFRERDFLLGAQSAFGMIVKAFAAGDGAALRPLLADNVFKDFLSAIAERRSRGESLDSSILSYEDIDLIEARLEESVAILTVRFVTRQKNITSAADGAILEASEPSEEAVDVWSFSRDTRSPDPNWLLIATRTA